MDYTVGSIADLISGKNTPNKPKIQKLAIAIEQPTPDSNIQEPESSNRESKIKKKKKRNVNSSGDDSDMVVINHEIFTKTQDDEADSTVVKRSKKRKPVEGEEEVTEESLNNNELVSTPTPKKKKKKEKKVKENIVIEDRLTREERDSRTVFVGNVPVTIKKRQLLRLFNKYGHVESVRLRCIAPAEPGIPKRVAFIKKLMHPKRLTMHSYITFTLREDALKALEANGMKYKDHHLRVQISNDNEKPEARKAIFVGNLPFDIEDEELWSTFESCGPIVSVRVIRDASTNMGIGIAYINFESSDSVELALQMDNVTIKKNVIRIHRYSQKKKHGQRHQQTGRNNRMGEQKKKGYKRPKNYPSNTKPSGDTETGTTNVAVKHSVYQGSKSNIKKKKPKLNKGVVNKMKLSKKIAPR